MHLRLSISLLLLSGLFTSYTALAQITAPSQGGEVGLTRVTATTIDLTFGTRGTGQGRVVAVAAVPDGQTVPLSASDNTFYTANNSFGLGEKLGRGYTVYYGTGHTATITGLQPNTKYYFTNAEYNTDGSSIMYTACSSSIVVSTRALPLATDPISSASSVEIYPNPSAGQAVQVLLLGFERENLTLSLVDILGRPVVSQNLLPPTSHYQTPLPTELAAGTYLLTLRSNDRTIQKRFTVSN